MDHAKLGQLAVDAEIAPYTKKPPLTLKDLRTRPPVDSHATKAARDLLASLRRASPTYKDPRAKRGSILKSKSTIKKEQDDTLWKYHQPELDSALQHALDTNQPPTMVAALLKEGSRVKFKKVLPRIVNTWDDGLASLLLSYRQNEDAQSALDNGLEEVAHGIALLNAAQIDARHVGMVSVLVASGARVSRRALETAVLGDHEAALETLLRSKHPIPSEDLSSCISEAVKRDNIDILRMLLVYGANPDVDGAECVYHAVTAMNYKIAVALFANPLRHEICRPNLAKLVHAVIQRIPRQRHFKWLELTLAAGADPTSPEFISRLREAVAAGEIDLALLLVRSGAPVADRRSNALEVAVRISDKQLVSLLLQGSAQVPSSIASLLSLILEKFEGEERIEAVQEFVSAGASGVGLNEALAYLVEEVVRTSGASKPPVTTQRLLVILLESSASVDWDGGVILKDAFAARNVWLVRQLCLKGPDRVTLVATMALLGDSETWNSENPSVDLVEPLLRCYPDSNTLSQALLDIIRGAPNYENMVRKFLDFQADVCWQQGIIINEAILHCDLATLKPLVQQISRPEIIDMYFYDSLASLAKAKLLLQRHRSQTALDEALTRELSNPSTRYNVLEFLLENNASMDHDGGSGLQSLCKKQDLTALGVIQSRGSDATRGKALCSVIELGIPKRIQISRTILGHGCPQNSLNDCLVLAVTKTLSNDRSGGASDAVDDRLELIQLLLSHKSDVNHGEGAALKAAIADSAWRLLEEMIKCKPNAAVMNSSFSYARSILKTDGCRFAAYKLLLCPAYGRLVDLDDALVDAAQGGSQHRELWDLLLSKGSSVNHRDGRAVMAMIQYRSFTFLPLLLQRQPSAEVLNKALASVLKIEAATRFQPTRWILKAGASGEVLDHAINVAVYEKDDKLMALILEYHKKLAPSASYAVNSAAAAGNVNQLQALLACVEDSSIVTGAFRTMITQSTVENVPTGQECASLLLEKGVEKHAASAALKSYIETRGRKEPDRSYIAKLLEHGADVNAFKGRSLQAAVESHHRDVLLQLAAHGTTSATLTQIMPRLFLCDMPEEDVIEIVEAIFNQKTKPRINEGLANDSLTYLSLQNYPHSLRLLQTLLRCGYSVDWERNVVVDTAIGEEIGNALLWAIAGDCSERITVDVLRALLDAQVNVNFDAPKSGVTPLMLAASNSLIPVADLLLEYSPDIDARDRCQRTAQSYASENGCLEIVQRLIERGSTKIDGSLHEAARELHHPIVRYLLAHEYGVDDPCTLHEGRSALQEVLLKTQILTPNKRSALDKTLKALIGAGADPKLECCSNGDKNPLYCALDNDHPIPILEGFLATGQWKYLDERYNWYTGSDGLCYSATKYLERGPWKGKPAEGATLINLLRMQRCKDRYFVWEGEQPPDAVNPPEELAEQHRQRRAIADKENFQLSLAKRSHSQQMELSKATHALMLEQAQEKNKAEMEQSDLQHEQQRRHQEDADRQRLSTLQIENDKEYSQQKRLGDARMAESDHTAKKEVEVMNRRKEIESWRLDRMDQSQKKTHDLVMKQIDAQKRLTASGYPGSPLAIMPARMDSVWSSGSDMPD